MTDPLHDKDLAVFRRIVEDDILTIRTEMETLRDNIRAKKEDREKDKEDTRRLLAEKKEHKKTIQEETRRIARDLRETSRVRKSCDRDTVRDLKKLEMNLKNLRKKENERKKILKDPNQHQAVVRKELGDRGYELHVTEDLPKPALQPTVQAPATHTKEEIPPLPGSARGGTNSKNVKRAETEQDVRKTRASIGDLDKQDSHVEATPIASTRKPVTLFEATGKQSASDTKQDVDIVNNKGNQSAAAGSTKQSNAKLIEKEKSLPEFQQSKNDVSTSAEKLESRRTPTTTTTRDSVLLDADDALKVSKGSTERKKSKKNVESKKSNKAENDVEPLKSTETKKTKDMEKSTSKSDKLDKARTEENKLNKSDKVEKAKIEEEMNLSRSDTEKQVEKKESKKNKAAKKKKSKCDDKAEETQQEVENKDEDATDSEATNKSLAQLNTKTSNENRSILV